ncbi:MAG: hypothetical protein ACI9VS_001044, partial [Candidatus Binatia bacterium]
AAFHQSATNQVIDELSVAALAHAFHDSRDPLAGHCGAEGNAAFSHVSEDQFKMLELFDGDGVELAGALVELGVTLKRQRRCGRLAFEMSVVEQDGRQVVQHLRQPVGRDLFMKQKHAWIVRRRANAGQ